ncbi:hypothetical protein NG99_17060 [Erwinia typographi]|uniref:Uncharacterized protein n=1 Tax=Erwinia typographi TaxID=371042 RepID=A0A0A4A078_9GAMM|nr:hypothetical protein [Erwinia typographi]KGT91273.1 hypothetical protein NG99_17060 [Erwinia typographi]
MQVDLNDPLVKASVSIDDGRDWKDWLVWDAKKNYRRSMGIYEPEPARPQVAQVKIEPKKKNRKPGRRAVQQPPEGM